MGIACTSQGVLNSGIVASILLASARPFEGTRYSLVFYTCDRFQEVEWTEHLLIGSLAVQLAEHCRSPERCDELCRPWALLSSGRARHTRFTSIVLSAGWRASPNVRIEDALADKHKERKRCRDEFEIEHKAERV